jgi:hypothetical protein
MDCTNDLDNQQPYSPIVAPTITVEPTMTPVAETTSPATIGTSNTTSPSSIEIVVTTVTETIPRNKFELLTWETCDKDEEDVPIGFEGRLWNNFSVLKLRNICSKLQVYGIKNAKKENIIESIVTTYQNTKAYSTIRKSMTDDNQQGTRKEVQCPYRLMNILFSDDFVEDFSTIGNGANRRLLDTGKAGNEEHFWRKVKDAYMISKADYNVLQFREDDVFASENIYPGKIVAHEWKKLRSIWKGVNADYKQWPEKKAVTWPTSPAAGIFIRSNKPSITPTQPIKKLFVLIFLNPSAANLMSSGVCGKWYAKASLSNIDLAHLPITL